jgi:hypothetical protein
MGTNYYTKINSCDKCGRSDDIHLGKSSAGWQFSFQYNRGQHYKSVPQMKEWLKDKIIKDEYGGIISHKAFWKMIDTKQKKEKHNHAKEYPHYVGERVIEGYSFSDTEFS